MCQAFSCIVTKQGKVYYKVGIDSHDLILDKFKIRDMDDEINKERLKFARVEITPDDGYLYPEGNWTLKIDERIKPGWWSKSHEVKSYKALEKWMTKVYSIMNLEEARNPINPLLLPMLEVTPTDIENLHKWGSVRGSVGGSVGASVRGSVWSSVGASVGGSVWNSVRGSVGDSVWAYTGGLFSIRKWKYTKHKPNEYPFQSCVDLWKRGFVPSFDGKTWKLHTGKDAKVVYEVKV